MIPQVQTFVLFLSLFTALSSGCASAPPSTERPACLKFRSSSEVNESGPLVLILVGVTNPEAFRSASQRELLSDDPPGTEGKATSVTITPGEAGIEHVLVDRLSKRLGVIADYRNRSTKSKIATDLPIRCQWFLPSPSVDLMRDTIDD